MRCEGRSIRLVGLKPKFRYGAPQMVRSLMGIDHGGFNVMVAHELLDGWNVHPTHEQVGSEGVAQRVQFGQVRDACPLRRPNQPDPQSVSVDLASLAVGEHKAPSLG